MEIVPAPTIPEMEWNGVERHRMAWNGMKFHRVEWNELEHQSGMERKGKDMGWNGIS